MKGEILMSQDNNINSTSKQILLDFIATFPSKTQEINEFMKLWSDNDYNEVDKKFSSHQYPTNKITFNKCANLEACPELQALLREDENAYIILKTLIDINKSPNNLISIPVRSTAKDEINVCNLQFMTGIRKDNIYKSIKVLLEYDFIRIFQEAKRGHPTIYMINPKYSTTSKSNIDMWYGLEKGSAKFDNIHDYQTKLIPITKQKAYYDDEGNEIAHNMNLKVSTLTVPDPDATSEGIKLEAFSTQED